MKQISFIVDTITSTFKPLTVAKDTGEVSDAVLQAVGEVVNMKHPDSWTTVIGQDDSDHHYTVSVIIPKSTDEQGLLDSLKKIGVSIN
ncbi:MAG: hypothetical protein ABIJ81_02260 [Patescibacteria group bacterium]